MDIRFRSKPKLCLTYGLWVGIQNTGTSPKYSGPRDSTVVPKFCWEWFWIYSIRGRKKDLPQIEFRVVQHWAAIGQNVVPFRLEAASRPICFKKETPYHYPYALQFHRLEISHSPFYKVLLARSPFCSRRQERIPSFYIYSTHLFWLVLSFNLLLLFLFTFNNGTLPL